MRPWLIRAIGALASGVVLAVFLYSCASRLAPQPVAPPVLAQPIQPTAAPTPVSHTAKASWYGPGLAGQKTTSGEPYNPEALTAASKTLPLGSVVKVTNPENGKSVKVRINDRGPSSRDAVSIYRSAPPSESESSTEASHESKCPSPRLHRLQLKISKPIRGLHKGF